MEAVTFYQLKKEDLTVLVKDLYTQRFHGIEVDAKACAQILQISVGTVGVWTRAGVLNTSNDVKRGGVMKFRLSYLLSLDKDALKKEYRRLNQ